MQLQVVRKGAKQEARSARGKMHLGRFRVQGPTRRAGRAGATKVEEVQQEHGKWFVSTRITCRPGRGRENGGPFDRGGEQAENGAFRSRFGCETMLFRASNPKFCRRLARGLACELGAESWIEVRKAPLRSSSPRLRLGSLSGSTTCHEAAKGLGATAHSASLQLPAQRRFLIQSQCCLWPGPEVALPSTGAAPLQGIVAQWSFYRPHEAHFGVHFDVHFLSLPRIRSLGLGPSPSREGPEAQLRP